MAGKRHYGVNWDPYRELIQDFYVERGNALEATLKYLQERYGLDVTQRQFKHEFGGKKKASAQLWTESIGPLVRKRARDGKESAVYLDGKRLSPKRVQRALTRYSAPSYNNTPTGFTRPLTDARICVRTPSPAPSSFGTSGIGIMAKFPKPVEPTRSPLDLVILSLVADLLPWNQMLTAATAKFGSVLPRTMTSDLTNLNEHHISGSASVLSQLIGLAVNTPPITIASKLPELIPPQVLAGSRSLLSHTDTCPKSQIIWIFAIVALMVSNGKMPDASVDCFINRVIEGRHENFLAQFLSLNLLTTKAFAERLVGPAARLQKPTLLKGLANAGLSLDHAAVELMTIDDFDFRSFLLAKLSPQTLAGSGGGRLLSIVVASKDIFHASQLIRAGASINPTGATEVVTTPLLEAVRSGYLDMVKLMVQNGARINDIVERSPTVTATAVSEAVRLGYAEIVKYLLAEGGSMKSYIEGEPLISFAERTWPGIYNFLVAAWPPAVLREITVRDILAVADNRQTFASFLYTHPISQDMAMKSFQESLVENKTDAAINLMEFIGEGPSERSDLALRCVLEHDELSLRQKAETCRLLAGAGAGANARQFLNLLVQSQLWGDNEVDMKVVVDILIGVGFDLQHHGPSLVETAFDSGIEKAALYLVERGTCVDTYGTHLTAFQAAAWNGTRHTLESWFQYGPSVNRAAFPDKGMTALQAASMSKSPAKVHFLLEQGADVNAAPAECSGVTALEAAVRPEEPFYLQIFGIDGAYRDNLGASTVFRLLLSHGAFVNRAGGARSPLLHDIISRRLVDLLELALDAGADPNQRWHLTDHEQTPMQLAAGLGDLASVKLLMAHGGNPNAPAAQNFGRTVLQEAASAPNATTEMIDFLLSNHVVVNEPPAPAAGVTALQGAAIQGHISIACLLLTRGAAINAEPALSDGRTAIEGAAEHGRLDMVSLLIEYAIIQGVWKDADVSRAISLARGNGHYVIADMLEGLGVD